jgi:hypothetical protein
MVKLYVEGGGDTAPLKTACREGFTTFLTKVGVAKRPRVVACGSRRDAYESFCTAVKNGEAAVLLVDSEGPVVAAHQQGKPDTWQPWQHLKQRPGDGWDKPTGAADTDCHLMVQIMESWFLADRATLAAFFGQGFKENQLPAVSTSIEVVPKPQIYQSLENATKDCKTKTPYGKDAHSFKLLALIDPAKVTSASYWAKRFVDQVKKKMGE